MATAWGGLLGADASAAPAPRRPKACGAKGEGFRLSGGLFLLLDLAEKGVEVLGLALDAVKD